MRKFLTKLFSKDTKEEAEDHVSIPEKRTNPRYHVLDFAGVFVELPTGERMRVKDLSYGGFATDQLPQGIEPGFFKEQKGAKLSVLGRSCEIKMSLVFQGTAAAGFTFVHDDATTLLFLRSILEEMRHGASANALDKSMVKEKFRGESWTVMRGEGPVDICFESDDGATTTSGLVTFMRNKVYCDLSLKGSSLRTSLTIDDEGTASRMAQTERLDVDVLRSAIHILLGAYSATGSRPLKEWITRAIDCLPTHEKLAS